MSEEGNRAWRVAAVDDDEGMLDDIRDVLKGEKFGNGKHPIELHTFASFGEFEHRRFERFDALILDVRDDDGDSAAGRCLFEDKLRTLRFVPVVFYTALPQLVGDIVARLPFVSSVSKSKGVGALLDELRSVFQGGIPDLLRRIDDVQREFLWQQLPELHDATHAQNGEDAGFLIGRRLARLLAGPSLRVLLEMDPAKANPAEWYVIPPDNPDFQTGDVVLLNGDYKVVLTPSCDLVTGKGRRKPEHVLIASCRKLVDEPEVAAWLKDTNDPDRMGKVKRLLSNMGVKRQQTRFHYLPGIGPLPDLLVDFQRVQAIPHEELEVPSLKRLATVDSPESEYLLQRFTTHYARVGVTDLDLNLIMHRIADEASKGVGSF